MNLARKHLEFSNWYESRDIGTPEFLEDIQLKRTSVSELKEAYHF